jgi:hypothetical protein
LSGLTRSFLRGPALLILKSWATGKNQYLRICVNLRICGCLVLSVPMTFAERIQIQKNHPQISQIHTDSKPTFARFGSVSAQRFRSSIAFKIRRSFDVEKTRRQVAALAAWGSCKLAEPTSGNGTRNSTFRFNCDFGPVAARLTLDPNNHKLAAMDIVPLREQRCVP